MRRLILAPVLALSLTGCAAVATRAIAAARKPDLVQMLQRADGNGDGTVTRVEFADARNRMFSRLDRSGDGYLTKDDAPRRLAARRRGGGDGLKEAMATLDKDGDGRISRDEFVGGPGLLFDRADANHDGVVDAPELTAFRAAAAARQSQ